MVGAIRRICWRKRFDRNAFAGEHSAHAELALEFKVFAAQTARFDGVLNNDQGTIERERLLKEIVRAELGGFYRGFNGAVAGDDDDLGPLFGDERMDVSENIEAVTIGEPDVEQDDVVGCVLDEHKSLSRGGSRSNAVAFFAENLFERGANLRLIIDHEDMIHERASVRGVAPETCASCAGGSA